MISLGFSAQTGAATPQAEVSFTGLQYAREDGSSRLGLDLSLKGDEVDSSEVRALGFMESGTRGDWSLDIDPMVFRRPIEAFGHAWIGRTQPFVEASPETEVSHLSALGDNWVQNRSDALTPRVSGWIGAGFVFQPNPTGFSFTAAGSPIFLPSFGPGLSLSADKDPSGSRFARLPPYYIRFKNTLVPLRYQVDTGDLRDIVLQNQLFVAASWFTPAHDRFSLMGWSQPSPNPSVDTSGQFRVDENDANVLVTVRPRFERENYVAGRWDSESLKMRPVVDAAYELRSRRFTLSGSLQPLSWIQAGALHTLRPAKAPDPSAPDSPFYDDSLVWTRVSHHFHRKLEGAFRLEQHLAAGRHGQWLNPELNFEAAQTLNVFASASFISGTDTSYFGTWRTLDSIALGARYLW